MNIAPVLIAMAGTLTPAAEQWPTTAPQDRNYFCGEAPATAAPPAGYATRLRAEIHRLTNGRLGSRDRAMRSLDAVANCRAQEDSYARNWPAIEPADNSYLCSVHRGDSPKGYSQRLHLALVARVNRGMGMEAAARDIRTLGACELPATPT